MRFLRREAIENSSCRLLAAYHERFGQNEFPPVPVEEILESLLGLSLEFDDLRRRLGMEDVLGATWIKDRRVVIDQSLDPSVDPAKEGRYRFTVAHELGHWELHRHHLEDVRRQKNLFVHDFPPSVVCRTSSRKDPMEWQADAFAGYLLMPKQMVYDGWESFRGGPGPYLAVDEIKELSTRKVARDGVQPVVGIARNLAREFLVSGVAMQIRLVDMGLIQMEEQLPDLC